jgi:hypothetical protein
MDIDIAKLAADTAKFLAPFLPFLIEGGKAAAQVAGKKFGEATWRVVGRQCLSTCTSTQVQVSKPPEAILTNY